MKPLIYDIGSGLIGRNTLGALGLTASGPRSIKSGAEYEKYFDTTQLKRTDPIIKGKEGTVYDTLDFMQDMAVECKGQTAKISKVLKGASRLETCRNLWNFLYHNFQYKEDSTRREQLRDPLRSWADRKSGIDCDCYSIFAGSVLENLSIPFTFRMAKYKDDWQHVYVVVPASGSTITSERSSYIVIDPVLNKFNTEQPPTETYDQMEIQRLNGAGNCPVPVTANSLRRFTFTDTVIMQGLVPTGQFLEENNIPASHILDTDTNSSYFEVLMPSGCVKQYPTIINPDVAAALKVEALTPTPIKTTTTTTTKPTTTASIAPGEPTPGGDKKKSYNWLWYAGAGLLALYLISSDEPAIEGTGSLDGVKKKTTKPKRKLVVRI